MNKSTRPEIEAFYQALEAYRSIVKRNKDTLEENPWLEKQVTFWIGSARFLITELEVWVKWGTEESVMPLLLKRKKL